MGERWVFYHVQLGEARRRVFRALLGSGSADSTGGWCAVSTDGAAMKQFHDETVVEGFEDVVHLMGWEWLFYLLGMEIEQAATAQIEAEANDETGGC